MSVTLALLALAGMISAVTAATVVPRTQYQQQEYESQEAALIDSFNLLKLLLLDNLMLQKLKNKEPLKKK